MNKQIPVVASLFILSISLSRADSETVNNLLQQYTNEGAISANADQGRVLWQKTVKSNGEFPQRSCVSCHTQDLTAPGKHIKTRKQIKAMTPTANPERLSDVRKVNKWFKRNCKWTLGRECSAQEKANLLIYINNASRF